MDAPIDEERSRAIRRLKAKREFRSHLTTYVVVNALLVVIWAITSFGDYFWPVWPMAGWGVGIALHGWDVYQRKDLTEEEIQREIERSRRTS